MMETKILGYKIFNKSIDDLVVEVGLLDKVNIVSGNPEVLYNGLQDPELNQNFNSDKSIIIPDGVGTVIASKIVKRPVRQKIAGIDVMKRIITSCEKQKRGIYLLGAQEEVVIKCKENLEKEHPNLKIVGYHNGFFDLNNCDDLIEDIKKSEAYAIFVAMGSPRQDRFIIDNFEKLPCKIFMGVGGSFDIFAGNLKRAPKWMIKCGLEWLYRVIKEPFRIKRLFVIPKFLLKVIKENKNE